MKFKSLRNIAVLMVALIGLFSSCDNETDENNTPAPTGEGYFSMNIKAGDADATTRAGDPNATADELAIHSVRIVLYNADAATPGSSNVEYVFEYNLETPSTWTTPGNPSNWIKDVNNNGSGESLKEYIIPSGQHLHSANQFNFEFTTFAQRIKNKNYKMLVILNGQDKDKKFESAVYKATNKGFYLNNFYNAVEATIDPQTGVLKDGKGILMTNHQGLVTVSKSQLMKTVDEAHTSPIHVSVDRMVAKITVRHANSFVWPNGVVPGSATWALDITNKKTHWMRNSLDAEGPSDSMADLYAKDPNYSALGGNSLATEFNYLFNEGYLPSTAVSNQFGNYLYTLENTISETGDFSNYSNQVTRLILGYKYTPDGFNASDNYYIFNGKVISQEEMTKMLNSPTYEIPGLPNLRTAINSIDKSKYPLTGSGKTYFETQGLRYCPAGQLYFLIPIQHYGKPESRVGCYGVVRNNIYDITINSLTPPDVPGTYLSAEIQIQPWALRGQTNTIGVRMMEVAYAPLYIYHWYMDNGDNLYQAWWADQHGGIASSAPTHRSEMLPVGASVNNPASYAFYPQYQNYNYAFSSPASLVIQEGVNVLNLYYWTKGSVVGGQLPMIYLYFVDQQGNRLRVRQRGSLAEVNNPSRHPLAPTPDSPPNDNEGLVYVKPLDYSLLITDITGKEYKIINNNYVTYYSVDYSDNITIDYSRAQNDPIHAARLSGTSWTALNDYDRLAIICQPK